MNRRLTERELGGRLMNSSGAIPNTLLPKLMSGEVRVEGTYQAQV